MNSLHYTAFFFFVLFLIMAIIGQVTAWSERSFDKEHRIIAEALGHTSNAYLFIAAAFFIIAIVIEVIALAIYLMQLVGWL